MKHSKERLLKVCLSNSRRGLVCILAISFPDLHSLKPEIDALECLTASKLSSKFSK
jgi:hypothetical protein